MSEEEGGALYYITKEEFKKRLAELNLGITDLGKRYASLIVKNPTHKDAPKWQHELDGLTDDLTHNSDMMKRAEIEAGYNLCWVDGENNMKMRRCSKREFQEIYKIRKTNYVV